MNTTNTFRVDKFAGSDPLEVLEFLQNFRDSANHNKVSEAPAARLVTYFLEIPTASEVKAQLSQWEQEPHPPT